MHGQFLARDRALLLELLADALQRPHFELAELEKLRARRIEFIRAAKDSEPQSLIGTYGRALLFAATCLSAADRRQRDEPGERSRARTCSVLRTSTSAPIA